MTKYVLTYHDGGDMPETEEAVAEVMAAWSGWFESLGESVIDGGNPFGQAKSIAADGSVSDGSRGEAGGYSVISADSLDHAVDKAKGCPMLAGGGTVAVHEALDM